MNKISLKDAQRKSNSANCHTTEYSFGDNDIDLGVAVITGRYPEKAYCINEISKELVYVIEGEGKLFFENSQVDIKEGDSLLINPMEKFFFETSYLKISISCSPAWNFKQYRLVD